MEKAAVLYSGGKDSSLVAYLLSKYYDVTLVSASFGIINSWKYARDSAGVLGLKQRVKKMSKDAAMEAVEIIVEDGLPRYGLNFLHTKVLNEVAEEYNILADGTRRDDRSLCLSLREIRKIEDAFDVEYIAPLKGAGYKTINKLSGRLFEIEEHDSEEMKSGDYETELRALMRDEGYDIGEFFPSHKQSRIVGMR